MAGLLLNLLSPTPYAEHPRRIKFAADADIDDIVGVARTLEDLDAVPLAEPACPPSSRRCGWR